MNDSIDSQGFRANVGIVISNDAGRLLLARRAGQDGWQFPQGGIGPSERIQDAMYRELSEEVGLDRTDVKVLARSERWLRYRLPARYVRRNSKPVCIGQKQRWFLLRLLAADDKVRFDRGRRPEFDNWRWADYWEPVTEVIYFKRRVYAQALREFAPKLYPDGAPPEPKPRRRSHGRS